MLIIPRGMGKPRKRTKACKAKGSSVPNPFAVRKVPLKKNKTTINKKRLQQSNLEQVDKDFSEIKKKIGVRLDRETPAQSQRKEIKREANDTTATLDELVKQTSRTLL